MLFYFYQKHYWNIRKFLLEYETSVNCIKAKWLKLINKVVHFTKYKREQNNSDNTYFVIVKFNSGIKVILTEMYLNYRKRSMNVARITLRR